MQDKKRDTELASELKVGFIWQDEVWDVPENVAGGDQDDHESGSPSIEELIEIVLGGDQDPAKKAGCKP